MIIEDPLGKVTKTLAIVSTWLAMLNLIGLVVLFVVLITLRLFGISVPSSDEFGSIMLAGLFAFGLAAAVAENEHLEVLFLVDSLPSLVRRPLILFAAVLSVLVVGLLLHGMSSLFFSALSRGAMMLGSLPIPRALPIGVVAVGVFLFEIALFLRLLRLIVSGDKPSLAEIPE